jgi:hypothetical protein
MALLAMNAHRLRTFLTMLGIIIGIASVVSVVALGNGSQQQILQNISALGTNTIDVYPGRGFGDMRSARADAQGQRCRCTGKAELRGQRHPQRVDLGHRALPQPVPPPRSAASASSSSGSRA